MKLTAVASGYPSINILLLMSLMIRIEELIRVIVRIYTVVRGEGSVRPWESSNEAAQHAGDWGFIPLIDL